MSAAVATVRAALEVVRPWLGTGVSGLRALARAALRPMRASDCPSTPLFAADTTGRPVGIPHAHDMPRAGIA